MPRSRQLILSSVPLLVLDAQQQLENGSDIVLCKGSKSNNSIYLNAQVLLRDGRAGPGCCCDTVPKVFGTITWRRRCNRQS